MPANGRWDLIRRLKVKSTLENNTDFATAEWRGNECVCKTGTPVRQAAVASNSWPKRGGGVGVGWWGWGWWWWWWWWIVSGK